MTISFGKTGLIAAVLLASTTAAASPSYFGDRTTFETAAPTDLFQGFELTPIATPIMAFYNGYTISSPGGISIGTSQGNGAGNSFYPTEGRADFSAHSQVDFTFESTIYAFGIDVIDFATDGYPASLAIETDAVHQDLILDYQAFDHGLSRFYGVVDPAGFNHVRLLDNDPFDYLEFDALAVRTAALPTPAAAAVPEPSSWALLLAGFGLTGYLARRRPPSSVAA